MNIEGVNLSSLLPGNNTIEVPGVRAFPGNFSNALMGQIEVLSEATVQIESPGPLPNMTMPQTVNNGTDIGDLLKHNGDEQELAALFGKYLPVSNENDLNEDIDLEATLLALTDSLKAVTPDGRATDPISMSDEVAAQNMGLILTDSLKAVTSDDSTPDPVSTAGEVTVAQNKSLNPVLLTNSPKAVTADDSTPDPVSTADEVTVAQNPSLNRVLTDSLKTVTSGVSTPDPVTTADEVTVAQNPSLNRVSTDSLKAVTAGDNTTDPVLTSNEVTAAQNKSLNPVLTDSLKAVTPDSDTINPAFSADEMTTTDNMNLALTDLLKTITPGIIPDEVAVAQNRTEVTALKGLYLTTPLPEEAKLNEEHAVPGDFLQKETAMRQSIQDRQGFNLPHVENTAFTEKTLVIEKHAPIAGIEQVTPGTIPDITPFHRLIDNKADSPVITRPLTHPGWSKDLGEQIVWMNNKAIPAAEIRLNPVHLGPISVRIDVNQDQATILFTAQHTEVREAIEASIPKLREMLGTQQLNLVNVNISQNSSSDQGRSQSQTFAKTPENREQGIEIVAENEHDRVAVSKGLLSIYA